MTSPVISFAVASYNASSYLEAAVKSALGQRRCSVEVLIVDDRSSDTSWQLAQELAARDDRIRVWQLPENRGPAAARNLALDHARGEWFAVLDSDDLIHPERGARLISQAVSVDADIIADDLLIFDEDQSAEPRTFLAAVDAETPSWLDLPRYLAGTKMFGRSPNFGFLKPMIRLETLHRLGLRYDERLRIAEDDDFILRLLLADARYRLLPAPLYFYRKHGQSISHRLSSANAALMVAAGDRIAPLMRGASPEVQKQFDRRQQAMRHAMAFTKILDALNHNQPQHVLRLLVANPGAVPLLRMPVAGLFAKLRRRLWPVTQAPEQSPADLGVLFVSRQRIAGATSGSSAYVLALAEAVRACGLIAHLLVPSPVIFGRTPFFRLRKELAVFETVEIRSAIRIGSWVIARDPAVFLGALRGVAARILRRLGARGAITEERKAPYSVAAPWTAEDFVFVAAKGRNRGRVAIADYVFQTEALPYLLQPGVRTGIIMHDLFSTRHAQFDREGALDSVAALSERDEIDLLSKADAVIAIQQSEADFVRTQVPHVQTILAPMAVRPGDQVQLGDDGQLLFVGSNTAPNVEGLRWFLESVWPAILLHEPQSRLDIVGTVCTAVSAVPKGVTLHGLVDELAPFYERAGLVISPLRQGSGLKIKLVEALRFGKAAVVTSTTLQGVEAMLDAAVCRADTPEAFCDAIVHLQRDPAARLALAQAALDAAGRFFSPEACHADFRNWLQPNAVSVI